MLNKDQKQSAESNSVAVQAGGDVSIVYAGLTFEDAKAVALDVFKANFHELAKIASEVANQRAMEITEEFLRKLQAEYPNGIGKSQEPDFQHALFMVQKEYALNGDQDLGDLLVDLLVDRSKQDKRNILQIVLNESINTAPKLTSEQLAVLAIIFLLKYTQNHGVGNHDLLGDYLDKHVNPFVDSLVTNTSCFQHLEFAGCGSIQLSSYQLEDVFLNVYRGLFSKGFDESELSERGISIGLDNRLFITCLNDSTKIQVKANNKDVLTNLFDAYSIGSDDREKISTLLDLNLMTQDEVRDKCIHIRPYMEGLFEAWNNSSMRSFTLTSVGMSIGHANLKRLIGEFADLSIWIN